MATPQVVTYFGIENAKYAIGASVKSLTPAKNLALNTLINKSAQTGNNTTIFEAISDQGFEGTLGLTAQPEEYETALGLIKELAAGKAQLKQVDAPKHALYYEVNLGLDDNTTQVLKCWVLGVTVQRASRTHTGMGESTEFGEYSMPIRAVPQTIFENDGTTPAKDAKGHVLKACLVTCAPGEDGYDTFDATVPELKLPAAGG